jgi:hypothetical protein
VFPLVPPKASAGSIRYPFLNTEKKNLWSMQTVDDISTLTTVVCSTYCILGRVEHPNTKKVEAPAT